MKKKVKRADISHRVEIKNGNATSNNFLSFLDLRSERSKTFFVFALIFLVGFFAFKEYLLFHSIFLFKDIGSDTLNLSYPNWVHVSAYWRNQGIPQWSFNQGMGQNILWAAISDPFSWPLYLLGAKYLPYGIGYMEFFKVLMGGTFFYLYLRMRGFTFYSGTIGALLFSFCGHMILGGTWYMFSSEAVGAAFLLFAFEKMYKEKLWVWFPLAIAYLLTLQPFYIYLYGLLLTLYTVVRFVNQEEFIAKAFFTFLIKTSLCCLLGAGIASLFLCSSLLQILDSPRGGGDASYFHFLSSQAMFGMGDVRHNLSVIMRFFSSDMLGSGSNFTGWQNYLESPILYCGLPALLLAPQIFAFSNKRQRIIYVALAGGCLLAILFPFFRYTFWLYTGDYYRTFSFFVALLILFFAVKSLHYIDSQRKISIKLLAGTLIAWIILLYFPYDALSGNKKIILDDHLKNIALFLLLLYSVLLLLMGSKKHFSSIRLLFLIITCVELCYFSSLTLNRRDTVKPRELTQKVGYNDYSMDAVTFLKERDKNFYRIDKDYSSGNAIHQSMNDAKAQDYYGTTSYNPFNQNNYIRFLKGVEIIAVPANYSQYSLEDQIHMVEWSTRWAQGLGSRPVLESLTSVKYNFFKNPKSIKPGFDAIAKFGDVVVAKNRFALPLGVAFNRYVLQSEFKKLPLSEKDFTLLRAFVIEDENTNIYKDLQRFDVKDTLKYYTIQLYDSFIRQLSDTLTISEHGQNRIEGKIHLNEKKLLFFSIPFDKGWSAVVDGKDMEIQLVNFGFMGLMLDKEDHVVTLTYHAPFLYAGGFGSLTSLALYFILIMYQKRKTTRTSVDGRTGSIP